MVTNILCPSSISTTSMRPYVIKDDPKTKIRYNKDNYKNYYDIIDEDYADKSLSIDEIYKKINEEINNLSKIIFIFCSI